MDRLEEKIARDLVAAGWVINEDERLDLVALVAKDAARSVREHLLSGEGVEWICDGGCGRVDIRSGIDMTIRCIGCRATCTAYIRLDRLSAALGEEGDRSEKLRGRITPEMRRETHDFLGGYRDRPVGEEGGR